MAHELEEFEKEQAVKEWLRSNIPLIIVGIVGGLLLAFGWTRYQESQQNYLGQAASLYSAIMANESPEAREVAATTLREEYSDTPYAVVAAFEMARQSVNQSNDLESAAQHLNWITDNARDPALRHLAAVRLARVQLAAGDAQTALSTLDGLDAANGFAALTAHVRGDVQLALGNSEAAIDAYQEALLDESTSGTAMRGIIEMKLSDLGAEAS